MPAKSGVSATSSGRQAGRIVWRARFESLDADKSGQIDLHEFIRFSLRDAAEMSEVELHATTPPNETTPAVEFAAARYAIIEAAGTVTLQVRRRGPLGVVTLPCLRRRA